MRSSLPGALATVTGAAVEKKELPKAVCTSALKSIHCFSHCASAGAALPLHAYLHNELRMYSLGEVSDEQRSESGEERRRAEPRHVRTLRQLLYGGDHVRDSVVGETRVDGERHVSRQRITKMH